MRKSIIVNANTSDCFDSYISNLDNFSFNFGNNICAEGLKNIFPDAEVMNLPSRESLSEYSSVILSLQDHLRPAVWKFIEDWVYQLPTENTSIPFVGANILPGQPIGVNPLPDKAKSFLREISGNSTIGCRGFLTETFVRSLGIVNTRIVGCASIHLGQSSHPRMSVNNQLLTAGGLGPSGANVDYWCQGDFDAILVKHLLAHPKLVKEERNGFCVLYHPTSTLKFDLNQKWAVKRVIVPYQVTDELRSFVAQYRGYVGGRVHGAIFAALQGVPAVCLANDLRAYDLCGTLGIPIGSPIEFIGNANLWLEYFAANEEYLQQSWLESSSRARAAFFN